MQRDEREAQKRDRKRQRRAGNIDGHKFEENSKKSIAYHQMKQMGWEEGQGIGLKAGSTESLKVKKLRPDAGLRGKNEERSSSAWIANVTGFAGVLAKLNAQYAPPAAVKEEEKVSNDAEEDVPKKVEIKQTGVVSAKRLKQKNMRNFSASDLKAIMGGTESVTRLAEKEKPATKVIYGGMFVQASSNL